MVTPPLVRDALPDVFAELEALVEAEGDSELVLAVDVVDSAIRYVEIISAETEAGQRVARVLSERKTHPQ
jgi:hypothetical protein